MIFSLLYSQLCVQGYAGTTCYKVPNEQPRPMCRASFCNMFGQACCSHILCVLHSPGIFHTSCTTLTSSDVRYCLNHICPQCLILCCPYYYYHYHCHYYYCIILSGSFCGNSQPCLSNNPTAWRHHTFRKIWAVPRMADNCALPKISGRLNLL